MLKCAGLRCGPGACVGARSKGILHFAADAVEAGKHLSGQAHHSRRFRHVTAHTRVEINPVAHRHVAHVLHAADQTGLRITGHDHACRIVQRLH